MAVSKEKWDELQEQMHRLGITDKDLIEKFILGSGKGGQKINKTSSCVYLCHLPSGIEIKCQKHRSRDQNRFFARRELCERLEALVSNEKSAQQQEREKIRRQKQRKTRKQKAKMVEDKRILGEKKALRRVQMD